MQCGAKDWLWCNASGHAIGLIGLVLVQCVCLDREATHRDSDLFHGSGVCPWALQEPGMGMGMGMGPCRNLGWGWGWGPAGTWEQGMVITGKRIWGMKGGWDKQSGVKGVSLPAILVNNLLYAISRHLHQTRVRAGRG